MPWIGAVPDGLGDHHHLHLRGTGEEAAKAQVGAATPVFYAFSPGGPLARRTGTDPATLRYFVKDLHGDVVGLAATTGTNPMKGSILYSPWGVPGTKTGELATFPAQGHLGFQGQLTDALTGQVDMLTRNHEPTMGRFDTRDVLFGDPIDPTSLNLSVYAEDAPVTFADLTGMKVEQGEYGTAGPCSRACEASLAEASAEYIAEHPDVYPALDRSPQMPPITTYSRVMFNPRLPMEERVAAAKVIYANYGEQAQSAVLIWFEDQQLANETSILYQVTHHAYSSWEEGPLAPKIIGGVLIVAATAGLICANVQGCAAYAEKVGADAAEISASTPVGSSAARLGVVPGTNSPAIINGVQFSGHAIDKLQEFGVPPSAAIDAVETGQSLAGSGTTVYYSTVNNLSVVMNNVTGRVVTVSYGQLKPR